MNVQPSATNLTVVLTIAPYLTKAGIIRTLFESIYLYNHELPFFSTPDSEMNKTILGSKMKN